MLSQNITDVDICPFCLSILPWVHANANQSFLVAERALIISNYLHFSTALNMANIYDHVSITINIKRVITAQTWFFSIVHNVSWKNVLWTKPHAQHRTTWHVKTSGIYKSVSYASSDVQIHRINTNTESWGTAWN